MSSGPTDVMIDAKPAYQEQVFYGPEASREEPRVDMPLGSKIVALWMLWVVPVAEWQD